MAPGVLLWRIGMTAPALQPPLGPFFFQTKSPATGRAIVSNFYMLKRGRCSIREPACLCKGSHWNKDFLVDRRQQLVERVLRNIDRASSANLPKLLPARRLTGHECWSSSSSSSSAFSRLPAEREAAAQVDRDASQPDARHAFRRQTDSAVALAAFEHRIVAEADCSELQHGFFSCRPGNAQRRSGRIYWPGGVGLDTGP